MHKGGVSIAPPLKRGLGYLALDPDDTVLSFLRFVDDLHEETAMRNAFLVVFVNPRGMNRRMIAWLERELDALPRDAEPAGVEDHLVV